MNARLPKESKAMRTSVRKIQRSARLAALLALSSLLAACASAPYSFNEGSVRAVRYKTPQAGAGVGLYLPVKDEAQSIIKRKDAFSVRLVSAFICDFREVSNVTDLVAHGNVGATPCPGGDGSSHPGTRGEIAIVASVGERRANAGLTFDPASVKNGRLVYYNEDVRETGQLINAINLPVYGPKTYEGRPFYMDWSVLELDNKENAAARKLLQQLAEIGTLTAAPHTPVLKLLNTLGSALIDANSDDLEMRFQVEMDSFLDCKRIGNGPDDCSQIVVNRLPLREGYYAFIRSENRSESLNLGGLKLSICADSGTLCDSTTKEPWRNRTWLLVRVAREDKDAALAQDTAQELAALMDTLNASASSSERSALGEATLKSVSAAIKQILDRQIEGRNKE